MGEFQGGQPLPTTGGRAPELLNFFFFWGGGSLLLMLTMHSIRTEAEPQHLGVLVYLCLHPLT